MPACWAAPLVASTPVRSMIEPTSIAAPAAPPDAAPAAPPEAEAPPPGAALLAPAPGAELVLAPPPLEPLLQAAAARTTAASTPADTARAARRPGPLSPAPVLLPSLVIALPSAEHRCYKGGPYSRTARPLVAPLTARCARGTIRSG